MVTVDKAIVARMQKGGKHFEVLVDADMAYDLKSGKPVSVAKMLAVNQIFTDSKKGDRAAPADVEKAFGTGDSMKVAEEIVRHGEVQLTTEYRRKKVEEKRKLIASIISRQAVDPRTKAPHPQERILNAMEQVHVNVDPFQSAEQQAEGAIKLIKTILPLSIEEVELTVEIPINFAGKAQGIMRQYGSVAEQWTPTVLIAKIKIPAGLKEKFFSAVNGVTGGSARITEKK